MINKILLNIPIILLALISFVTAHEGEEGFRHHGMMNGFYGYGMGLFGLVFMILFFVALVMLIIWLFKQILNANKH